MRKYNISANLVRIIEQLYDKATSNVQVIGSMIQNNSLSPKLFHIFLERIMSDALKEHDGKVSIGGRILPICGLPMTEMLELKKSRNQKSLLKVSTKPTQSIK